MKFVLERLAALPDPRLIGEALTGRRKGTWRYRAGDYRIICKILHGELVILVLEIGHRREVYR